MPRKQVQPRVHVSVNMAISLDGRISTRRREQIVLGTHHDRRLMDVLRARCDAVVVGAGTVRHDGFPILVRDPAVRARRVARGKPPHPVNVILSRTLDLPVSRPIFRRADTERVVFTTRQATARRVASFRALADVVVLPRQSLSPHAVLDVLAARGLRRVLVEGGGEIHWAFARADCVDEIYVTLTPRLIGGAGAPSLLDGKGFLRDEHRRLKLLSCRRVGDELFLRYRVLR